MTKSLAPAYTYSAVVDRWVDGDTVDLVVDVGFHITIHARFRLYGIDTPEHGQNHHDEAWHAAEALAPAGTAVSIKTYKDPDKYGRFLADIYSGEVQVNAEIIKEGLAVPYFGGTKAVA